MFNAVVSGAAGETLNTGDIINGGAGVDTLKVLGNGVSAQLLQSSNVENVEVRAVTATTISQQLMQGVQQVSSKGSSAALTVNSADLATTYMLDSTVAGQTAGLTVSYAAATGTSDTAKVSINNAGNKTGSTTTTQTVDVSSANAVEAVTLATAGTNYVTLNAGTGAKDITVTGSGVNTLTVGTSATALNFDASAATGAQTVTIAGVSLGDVIKGGKGSTDQLSTTVTSAATSLATISGFETLRVGFTAAGTFNASKTTDVSTLTLNDFNTAAATVTQLAADVATVNLQEATANTQVVSLGYVSGSESDVTVNIGATDTTAVNVNVDMGNLTVTGNKGALTLASVGEAANLVDAVSAADVTSLTLKATERGLTTTTVGAAKATTLAITADGSESTDITTGIITANIVGTTTVTADNAADITLGGLYVTGKNSSGADQSTAVNVDAKHADSQITISDLNSVTNLTNAVVDTLTVTGAGDVSITANDVDIDLPVVDATGLTGSFTLNAANSDIAMTVSLGNAATGETTNVTTGGLADVITGGSGADTINGGAGADVLSGGAGNDTFVSTLIADFATGEVIDGGAGTDVLQFGAAGAITYVGKTVSSVETLDLTLGATNAVVITQGTGLVTVLDLGAVGATLQLNQSTTAFGAAAEAAAADVNIAGEWHYAAGAADGVLTYFDESSSGVVAITLTGVEAAALTGGVLSVAGDLVFTQA